MRENDFEILFNKILINKDQEMYHCFHDAGMLALLFATYPEQEMRVVAKAAQNNYVSESYLKIIHGFSLQNKLAQPPTLDILARYPFMASNIGLIDDIPIRVNDWLACWKKTTSQKVKGILASHPSLPENMINKIASMSSLHILAGLARNVKCPMFLLVKLSAHPSNYVSDCAKETMHIKGGENNGQQQ